MTSLNLPTPPVPRSTRLFRSGTVVLGLLLAGLTGEASAQGGRRHVSTNAHGHMASSVSRNEGPSRPSQTPRSFSPTTPGTQNYNAIFATPGTNNTGSSGWGGSTAWNQPSNPWQGGGWGGPPDLGRQPVPQSRLQPQFQREFQTFPQPERHLPSWESSTPTPRLVERWPSDVPSTPSRVATLSGGQIRLRMPEWETRACSYFLIDPDNAWNYTMQPGKSQTFPLDRSWTIRFDRGQGHGVQSYRLQPGEYEFRQSARGWELYNRTVAASLAAGPAAPR